MVRFHLVGLIAVGLVIQFPSALADSESKCELFADRNAHKSHVCEHLRQSDRDAYLLSCFCSDQNWYRRYDRCLNKLVKDPGLIESHESPRCNRCRQYYDSRKLVPGELWPPGQKPVHSGVVVPAIAGCKPKGI